MSNSLKRPMYKYWIFFFCTFLVLVIALYVFYNENMLLFTASHWMFVFEPRPSGSSESESSSPLNLESAHSPWLLHRVGSAGSPGRTLSVHSRSSVLVKSSLQGPAGFSVKLMVEKN